MAGEVNRLQHGSVQYCKDTGCMVEWGNLSAMSRVRRGVVEIW